MKQDAVLDTSVLLQESSALDRFVLFCTKLVMEDGRCVSDKGTMLYVLILDSNAKDRVSTAYGRLERIGLPSIASSNTYK